MIPLATKICHRALAWDTAAPAVANTPLTPGGRAHTSPRALKPHIRSSRTHGPATTSTQYALILGA
eukprot:6602435-Lingulodinium_polyedra.AAC.1